MPPESPLARDRLKRPVVLPEKADSFLVYRVPSLRGGKPVLVQVDDYPLELCLDMTEERLLELVERPGKYRLDVLDAEGTFLNLSCWVMLKAEGAAGRYPAPQSAVEAVNVEMMKTFTESMALWSQSNTNMANALSRGAIAGPGGKRLPAIAGLDEDDPESIRELLNNAIRSSREAAGEETETASVEETAKKAEQAKIWINALVDTLSVSGPKALPLLQTLGAWLKSNKAGVLPGAGG